MTQSFELNWYLQNTISKKPEDRFFSRTHGMTSKKNTSGFIKQTSANFQRLKSYEWNVYIPWKVKLKSIPRNIKYEFSDICLKICIYKF